MVAILTQIYKEGKIHASSYASKQLFKKKKKNTQFLLETDALVWAMEYYQEHLRGRRFILYTDHKPLETLGIFHTKTMNRLQLAMLDFHFEISYKKGWKLPADFLSRSLMEMGAILALNMNWAHEQEKDNLSNLIRESLDKKWIYKFPTPDGYTKAEFLANMAVIKNNII
jgi:hypothetical protein